MVGASTSLNVSVTRQMGAYVKAKIATGGYQSASEVIRDAILALQHQEKTHALTLQAVRAKLASGLAQADRGELKDGDTIFNNLERGLDQLARDQAPQPPSRRSRKNRSA